MATTELSFMPPSVAPLFSAELAGRARLHVVDAHRPCVLIVDSHEMNRRMIKAILRSASYQILECARASDAMEMLSRERIDLVVLDLMLPEISGPDFCRWLKNQRKMQLIPILMLTSVQGMENEIAGISSGADEFLLKPVHPTVVRTRVSAMLRNKSMIDSLEQAETILFALAQAVERRDKSTGMHCERLASFSVMLGDALGLPQTDLIALYRGGFLHDIGKVSVPDSILFKPGKLTAEEWVVMQRHTVEGEQICQPMRSLMPVLPIIRNHHERWDGSGYPDGLSGERIPLLARILQVVDIYDALTTERPYKAALSGETALAVLTAEAERGWRDPELVTVFATILRQHPDRADTTVMMKSLANLQAQLSA